MCHWLSKNNLNIHLLAGWNSLIIFIATVVCKPHIIKFYGTSLAFFSYMSCGKYYISIC